ncbi:hypothetical protein [Paenibacillus sp. MMS20-IR301]|uniref:hypothetical protein n=1 Tax=Paenibacillus sp. MMS20-IR301 TaxID=2895946 RepID=UPI0028E355D9|nr:hypothetical protein [Paenibacillus sp. MMS20-IR301]WNS42042.1 hypothetical protein LOS79_23965 [Paenibacillus sp. MMS20-IR301]
MELYHIKGTVVKTGAIVNEVIEAPGPRTALRAVLRIHGRLKRRYDIYTESFLEPNAYPVSKPSAVIEPVLCDHCVCRIGKTIRNGTVTPDEYRLFSLYFERIIRSALRMCWTDVRDVPPSDMETEMIERIAFEFLPRFDARWKLRPFIRRNIISRLNKRWNRKKYVNGNIAKPRVQIEQQYAMATLRSPEKIDPEVTRNVLISTALRLEDEGRTLTRAQKKSYYQLIVHVGMHKECLKSSVQIETLEHCYGDNATTEREYGVTRGRKQATVHRNKRRAEDNVLKYIRKNLRYSIKTSVF